MNFKDNKAMNILHNNYFVQNLVIKSQLVQLKVEKCSEESTYYIMIIKAWQKS